ncbi:MAG: discoidin domain-containing protein, partial [Verrucomicrobia bacterium]|nr:discoidin domain-containing protein [Verrucomicrobiota bacterium]
MRPANEARTKHGAIWLSQLALAAVAVTAPPSLPENLALKARATANSEYSGQYLAKFAVDGQVPASGSHADPGKAWCVKGHTHRNGATLKLEWPSEVTIAEIVYYGRTAWFAEECWKDYEVCLDGAMQPVAKGSFQMGHGPQRIKLAAPAKARSVTLKFLSSYGGLNPGASEIQVFAVSPPDGALPKFAKLQRGATRPVVDETEQVKPSPELAADVKAGRLGFEK